MDAPVTFATKWDFVYATVLIGWSEADRRFYAQPSATSGAPLLAMWSDEGACRSALPAGYVPLQTPVAPRLAELPDGVGIVVDPGSPGSMLVEPDYAARLKPLTDPFPVGSHVVTQLWRDLPADAGAAIRDVGRRYSFVADVWALVYTVDDSPWIGLLVYATDGGDEAQESVVDALGQALDQTVGTPGAADVVGVHVLSVRDVPDFLREGLIETRGLLRD